MENKPDLSDTSIEQSQETAEPPIALSRADIDKVQKLAGELIQALNAVPDGDMVAEIVDNAMKFLRDSTNRGDIKLINKSFKELRYALKVFVPYREVHKVSIFGSARTGEKHPDYIQAAEFAKKMVAAGWMVITGAGGGIMAAGHGGAGASPSFGLSIRLPFEQKTNVHIANDPKLINFKYFFTRKLMFVRSSNAIALFPGGFGTMDEGFEVLTLVQTGKSVPVPIVFVNAPGEDFWQAWQHYVTNHLLKQGLISAQDLHLYKITENVDEAVAELVRFYRNYHSVRYARDQIVLRLRQAPSTKQLEQIKSEFKDINVAGEFKVSGSLPVERDEPTLNHLPRLVFAFNRRDHGRLRQLIDFLNRIE